MHLKESVFYSKSETVVFEQLLSQWSDRLRIYPNQGLSTIIEVSPDEFQKQSEFEFYLKTSIDYSICNLDNTPILGIEFDGLGGGISHKNRYYKSEITNDPNREWKLNFKLRLAQQVEYPLIIVSYNETKLINTDESLTILDSIIGQVLYEKKFNEVFDTLLEERRVSSTTISYEEFDRIGDTASITAQYESDPVFRKAVDYQKRILKLGKLLSWSYRGASISPNTLIPKVGCTIFVETTHGKFEETVFMNSIDLKLPKYKLYPNSMVENIARFLCFKKAYDALPKN